MSEESVFLKNLSADLKPFADKSDCCTFIVRLRKENKQLQSQLQQKENIIKEAREYLTSYESIETMQQCVHIENNKDLDEKTMNEMVRRYMIVHDKLLEILDKGE